MDAIREGGGVVGLESVVFTHGLPHDQGLTAAFSAEDEVRSAGGTPATCAIVDGTAIIGLTRAEIANLSRDSPPKANGSSMIASMGLGKSAALTAGATVRLCHASGISVVATGGIGGIHRGSGFDVSSDLHVLCTCPVIVVCSGAKIILDLHRTFEILETLEIITVGFRCSTAPGFYIRDTGIPLSDTAESIDDIVKIWQAARVLNHPASLLILNPPPKEHTFSPSKIEDILTDIERESTGSVRGKDVTPVILSRIQNALGPTAITLNRELLRSNARLAAEISVALRQ